MPQHKEIRVLPYTPQQLFDLVADIEHYPEFLPWCKAARILERNDQLVLADLMIGYKMFQEKFTSKVILDAPRRIEVEYMSGPLARLTNQWEFKGVGKGGCELSFHVDFDFRSAMLRSVMEMFFDKAISKMVAAFEERAAALYGPK